MHWTYQCWPPSVGRVTLTLEQAEKLRYGDAGMRRVRLGLFAAGLATFALLYTPQPLLPLLSSAFHASPAASGLVAPLPPSLPVLIGVRVLEGFALAGMPATAMAYLAEEVDRSDLSKAMG